MALVATRTYCSVRASHCVRSIRAVVSASGSTAHCSVCVALYLSMMHVACNKQRVAPVAQMRVNEMVDIYIEVNDERFFEM